MINLIYKPIQSLCKVLVVLLLVGHVHMWVFGKRDLGGRTTKSTKSSKDWRLLWSDEFDFFDGSKWEYQYEDGCSLGVCKWGNKERSWYTDSNMAVQNGILKIEAREEHGESRSRLEQVCWDRCGSQCAGEWNVPEEHIPGCVENCGRSRCPTIKYTSARVRTFSKFSISPRKQGANKVVKIEARIKLNCGDGMWPAFWLLPEEGSTRQCSGCGAYGQWPASGEIDVMEMFGGKENSKIHGTVHYGGVGQWSHRTFTQELTPKIENEFNVYSIEWSLEYIKFFLNGKQYGEARRASAVSPGWWTAGSSHGPFDVNFHLLLNMAVGGEYTNNTPDDKISRTIGAGKNSMEVDYVRVWGSS